MVIEIRLMFREDVKKNRRELTRVMRMFYMLIRLEISECFLLSKFIELYT